MTIWISREKGIHGIEFDLWATHYSEIKKKMERGVRGGGESTSEQVRRGAGYGKIIKVE